MMDAQTLAIAKEMRGEEFARWQHEPAGRLFFAYLEDQLANWREVAADMVQFGAFKADAERPMRNPHYVGGQMKAFDDLLRITAPAIQAFYREAAGGEENEQLDPGSA